MGTKNIIRQIANQQPAITLAHSILELSSKLETWSSAVRNTYARSSMQLFLLLKATND